MGRKVPPSIEADIANIIDQLKDDLTCMIEYPSVDKMRGINFECREF